MSRKRINIARLISVVLISAIVLLIYSFPFAETGNLAQVPMIIAINVVIICWISFIFLTIWVLRNDSSYS